MRSIRSRSLFVAAALVIAGAAAAASDDPSEVRRAAALLDYVQRDYATCVRDGAVVNAAEYAEQQAFAQDAADALARFAVGAPLAAEAREVAALIARKAPAADVSARAGSIHDRLLRAAGLSTAPPADVHPSPVLYQEACAACHGAEGRGDGFAAADLPTKPTDFTGPDRATLTPYRVFSSITWGVPHTAMPEFDTTLGERKRWEIALTTLAFGHSQEDAERGEPLARERRLDPAALVPLSDDELRQKFAAYGTGEARALLAWVRRIASFAGPPPAGFPDLRTQVALAGIGYVHMGAREGASRLRAARLEVWRRLEPLASRHGTTAVRDGFDIVRGLIAAGESRQRVLFAVAQLQLQVAKAGPESAPDAPALRKDGAWAAAREGLAAALAIAAAIALSRRMRFVPAVAGLAGAVAGAAIAARAGWPWWAGPCVQAGAALALPFAAPMAAAGAALAAAADAAASWAAARAVFPDLPDDFAQGAALAGCALVAVGAAAGFALPRRGWVTWLSALALLAGAVQQAWPARPW